MRVTRHVAFIRPCRHESKDHTTQRGSQTANVPLANHRALSDAVALERTVRPPIALSAPRPPRPRCVHTHTPCSGISICCRTHRQKPRTPAGVRAAIWRGVPSRLSAIHVADSASASTRAPNEDAPLAPAVYGRCGG
ncbi:hypothetical protein MRX96_044232 [Rhipicephalus microplus]